MRSDTSDCQKDYPELEDSLNNNENLQAESLLSQKRQQCSLVSNSENWLQTFKNSPEGSFSHATSYFEIPRHLVSLDEKYLRRFLDLINISAFKTASCSLSMSLVGSKMSLSSIDSPVIPKKNIARLVFDLPLVDDSGQPVISPVITGCKRVSHKQDDNGEKGDLLRKVEEKVISLSSSTSSYSSEQSSSSSSPAIVSQGAVQFTMKDNKTPHFVFSLDDQKEIYVASLNTSDVGSGFDYSYLIHLKKAHGSEQQHLVGKLKVSTLFSVSSTNEKVVEKQFVLFNNGGNPQLPCHNRKDRGLSKKVVDVIKSTTRGSRQRSMSRFSRTSFWDPFQESDHDLEPISLLDNDLPPSLETLAVVVTEHCPEEEVGGGWGIKFLKKTPLARASKHSTSIDVVIPAGIHGGSRNRNNGPSSLIQRWKTGGKCDCSGWDLGCSLTILKGQALKDQNEDQCNLFELFTEGSKQGIPGVRIMNVRDGLCFVQFQAEVTVLQAFSIALVYIYNQSQRLRTWSSRKCT